MALMLPAKALTGNALACRYIHSDAYASTGRIPMALACIRTDGRGFTMTRSRVHRVLETIELTEQSLGRAPVGSHDLSDGGLQDGVARRAAFRLC
jgi:hypothetical protein